MCQNRTHAVQQMQVGSEQCYLRRPYLVSQRGHDAVRVGFCISFILPPHEGHSKTVRRLTFSTTTGFMRPFSLTRSCGGIAQDFGPIGAGNLVVGQEGPELAVSCANSSNG